MIVHGHGDNSAILHDRVDTLFSGFDRMYIDLRNHGRSDKKTPVTLGLTESLDVTTAIQWVNSKSWKKIYVYGTSMGAIAALLGGLKCNITAFILDSMFLNPDVVIDNNMKKHHLPWIWRVIIKDYLTKFRIKDYGFPDILEKINSTSIPLFYAHGTADVEAPLSTLYAIRNLNKSNIVTLVVDDAEHSRLYSFQSYRDAVLKFIG